MLHLLSLGICVLLLSLTLFLFSRSAGIVSRNEGEEGDGGVVGRSEEEADSRDITKVLAEFIDSDLLRFASQWSMSFVSLPERSAVFERIPTRYIVPRGKY